MKKIAFIFSLVIVLALLLICLILREKKTGVFGVKDSISICETKKELNDDLLEGKRQFNINCAACHRLNVISDPPILEKGIKNYNLNTFQKFIKNNERKRENLFDAECKPFPNLKNQKIKSIYNYIIYSVN